ncbi:MAG: alanine--glyoxylate aminotransferase family protein [Anaerolineales bacterium]
MAHLFVPGPVDVDPKVAEQQTRPMVAHRSKEFESVFHACLNKSKILFGTENQVYLSTSSGTGLQETAIRNFVKDRVLSCVNGAFSKRWYEVATTNGKATDKLEFEWNEPVNPDAVARALESQKYDAITVVHNETSTGMQNPIPEIAAAVRAASPDTIICVDTVSSLGGVTFKMDEWGVDFVLTSSQKALALPPGLSLCAVSARAMKWAEQVPNRGWYFDLVRLEKHRAKDSTPATPAVSLIYALDYQLDRIHAEGMEARAARHAEMAARTQEWALSHDFDLYAPEGYRSNTVTTIVNSLNVDVSALNKFLGAREMRISNGYGDLKNKTFRIAHMGEIYMQDLEILLTAMDEYLASVHGK